MTLPALNDRQRRCLRYVLRHGRIDASTHKKLAPYWSPETLRLDRAKLRELGLIRKRGDCKGAYYEPVG
jgi:hypothetical protein